ncbi:ADP-ribosylation factor-like 2-binding protein, partial [Pavlovales sp. CCMP2436]
IVFDLDDENKLVYMEIYQAFKDMVDSLLEFHLSDMGVTQEQFFAALASNPRTILAKQLLEQLLVIDDFLSFKKMMVKRNAELEAE